MFSLPGHYHSNPIIDAHMRNPALYFHTKSDEALVLYNSGKRDEALAILKSLNKEMPRIPEVIATISLIYQEQGKLKKALEYINQAIGISKNKIPELYTNRGNIYRTMGFYNRALQEHQKCLRLKSSPHAWVNMGCCNLDLLDYDGAKHCFEMALAIEPENHEARFNYGNYQLITSDCKIGWQNYEHRLWMKDGPEFQPKYSWPLWEGEILAGRTVLVHCEQGHGDTIQMCRYLKYLEKQCDKIILACPQHLLSLMQKSFPYIHCFSGELKIPNHLIHYRVHMMSLPLYVRHGYSVPYLISEKTSPIKSTRIKIGIFWAGNPSHPNDFNRSMPQELMMQFTKKFSECDFYSLQKDRCNDKLLLEYGITKLPLNVFLSTANHIDSLDYVIGIDSAVAHLAGAMGKKTLLLIPMSSDWRYGLTRTDCIWYPNHKIFRQSMRGDWRKVLEECTAYLKKELN